MAVDERTRPELHQRLDQLLGVDHRLRLDGSRRPVRSPRGAAGRSDARFDELLGRFDAHEQRMEQWFAQWFALTARELTAMFRGELSGAVV